MSSLAGKTLLSTYSSLLKLEGDTQTLVAGGGTAIQVKTGDNEVTPIYLNTDRVGIGTATPEATLHIAGTIDVRANSAVGSGLVLSQDGSGNAEINNRNPGKSIYFQDQGNTKMTIYGGKVGIGTVAPDTMLDIHSTGSLGIKVESDDNNAYLILDAHTGYDGYLLFKEAGTSEWIVGCDGSDTNKFKISESAALATNERFCIAEGGNVGIGTATPGANLTIIGTSAHLASAPSNNSVMFRLTEQNTGTQNFEGGFIQYDGSGNVFNIGVHEGDNQTLGSDNEVISIARATGNVGIGTASPNANAILDVTSTTKAFMPPRMTTTQRDAVSSPTAGMVIYNSTTNVLNFHNGSAWGAV